MTQQIIGYRSLSEEEVKAVNDLKELAEQVRIRLETIEASKKFDVDVRWLNIARTHLQQGFMAANRAITRPTTF